MSALRFVIPGEPRGKGRPRFGRSRAGFVTVRTDDKTATYENLVKLAALQVGARPFAGPLAVAVTAYFVPPPSWSKKRRAAALAGHETPSRFDIDNICKAVFDGLNGIAFEDDKQIALLYARKLFADVARCEIEVFPSTGTQEQSDGVLRDKAA
jgi:Holliday junction resolvase RusA-like endonuclease